MDSEDGSYPLTIAIVHQRHRGALTQVSNGALKTRMKQWFLTSLGTTRPFWEEQLGEAARLFHARKILILVTH